MIVAGLLVVGLLALRYSDVIALACWIFAVWFLFCYISLLKCALARWFLDVSSQGILDSKAEKCIRDFVRKNMIWGVLHFGTFRDAILP